jgi:hypothetical protein
LLGLVRIYSKKVQYLADDCSEALTKLKVVAKPGVVDLAEKDQVADNIDIDLNTSGIGIEGDFVDNLGPDMGFEGLEDMLLIQADDLDMRYVVCLFVFCIFFCVVGISLGLFFLMLLSVYSHPPPSNSDIYYY